MATTAELKAILGFDASNYKAGVKEVTALTSSFQKSISGIGGMLAGAFSIGGIIAFGKSLMNTAHEMDKIAEATNLSMGALVALKTVAAEHGMEMEQLSVALGKVRDAQGQVVSLAKPMSDALAKLGIDAEAFVGAGTDEALAMIAKGFVDAGGSAEAFSAVKDILGKNSVRMIEMLKVLDKEGLMPLIDRTKDAAKGFEELAAAQATLEKVGNRLTIFAAKQVSVFGQMIEAIKLQARVFRGELTTAQANMMFEQSANKIRSPDMINKSVETAAGVAASGGVVTGKPAVNSDVEQRRKNQAEVARKKAEEENKKAQELGRHYYFKESKNQDEIDALNANYAEKYSGVKAAGNGINADSVARIGGSIGGSRPGLAMEDRAIKIQTEQLQVTKDFVQKLEALLAKQEIERDRGEG